MKRSVIACLLSAAILLGICAAVSPAYAAQTAVVNNPNHADRLNLRTSPSTSALSLGKYYNGVEVRILLDDGTSWLKVRIGNTVGYMSRSYLIMGASHPVGDNGSIWASPTNNGKPIYVRDQNNTNGRIVHTLYNDAVVILGVAGDWYHIAVGLAGNDWVYGYVPTASISMITMPGGNGSNGSSGGYTPATVPDFPSRKVGIASSANLSMPVYSAPSQYSIRGANGRASVGLDSVFYTYGTVYSSIDRVTYMLVRYTITGSGARFGYIDANAVYDLNIKQLPFSNISATITRSVNVTDDPVTSYATLVSLPNGASVTVLAKFTGGGATWGYIEGTASGRSFRGFVPYNSISLSGAAW